MTTPLDSHEYDTVGAFTPHSANEGEHGAADWIAEVLPTDESAIDRTVHRDDHLPRGWHDFGAMGWAGVLLMVVVVGLIKAFTSVRLSGDRYVREVELREANGDVTHLRFSAMSETPATLSRDEAARFE